MNCSLILKLGIILALYPVALRAQFEPLTESFQKAQRITQELQLRPWDSPELNARDKAFINIVVNIRFKANFRQYPLHPGETLGIAMNALAFDDRGEEWAMAEIEARINSYWAKEKALMLLVEFPANEAAQAVSKFFQSPPKGINSYVIAMLGIPQSLKDQMTKKGKKPYRLYISKFSLLPDGQLSDLPQMEVLYTPILKLKSEKELSQWLEKAQKDLGFKCVFLFVNTQQPNGSTNKQTTPRPQKRQIQPGEF